MNEKFKLLAQFAEEKNREEFEKLIKSFTKEEIQELETSLKQSNEELVFENIEGHQYSGRNFIFLTMFSIPGVYGTFNQWRKEARKIKKGSKGFAIGVPIFDGQDEDKRIKYLKTVYIFHKNDTEEMKK